MNLLSSFGNFYNNLSQDGLFFFWIVLFLFLFLIFLTIVLLLKNRKLINLLKEYKDNVLEESKSEENPIKDEEKQEEVKEEVKKEEVKKEEIKKEEPLEEHEEKSFPPEEKEPYQKNVLRQMNTRMQTSPIHIDRKEETTDYSASKKAIIDMSSPLETIEDTYEINDSMKFASDIVNKMEEELKPSNIELTDYEKKQEEEAIISYDELLKVKDKIYNITEDEETDEFIDELKSLRSNL